MFGSMAATWCDASVMFIFSFVPRGRVPLPCMEYRPALRMPIGIPRLCVPIRYLWCTAISAPLGHELICRPFRLPWDQVVFYCQPQDPASAVTWSVNAFIKRNNTQGKFENLTKLLVMHPNRKSCVCLLRNTINCLNRLSSFYRLAMNMANL